MARKDLIAHNCNTQLEQRQNRAINRWCYRHKISRNKLETHPFFDDLVSLLMFDEWQQYMNSQDRKIWQHCWQWSYHRELPLSGHHRRKLTSIIDHILLRQQAQAHIQARIRQRSAKARRKRSHDNDDKGLRSLGSVTTDPDQ